MVHVQVRVAAPSGAVEYVQLMAHVVAVYDALLFLVRMWSLPSV